MNVARIVVLAVALAAGGAAAFLVSSGDEKKPAAPAPVVQLRDRRRADRQGRHRHGHGGVQPRTSQWQAWPAATTGDSYITKKDRPNAIEELAGAITRAPVHRRRADPRGQADQGQRRRRLHGGDPAVRHARGFDRNLAGDRRRRLHPAERPGRRHPVPPRQAATASPAATPTSETILTNVRVLAIDQTVEEKNGQRVVVGKTATLELTPRQAETLAQSRQLGTLSLALRSLLDASKTSEVDDRRSQKPRSTPSASVSARTNDASKEPVHDESDAYPHRNTGGADRHDTARPIDAGHRRRPAWQGHCSQRFRSTATRRRSSCRSASARASSSTCRATSRTCWWPTPRSPTRSCARRGAPTSSASRSDRPTSISSTPRASS